MKSTFKGEYLFSQCFSFKCNYLPYLQKTYSLKKIRCQTLTVLAGWPQWGRGLSSDVGVLAEAPSLCGIYTRNLTMFALPSLQPYKSRAALRDAGKCPSHFLYKSQLICIFMTSLACTLQVSICRTLQKEKKTP